MAHFDRHPAIKRLLETHATACDDDNIDEAVHELHSIVFTDQELIHREKKQRNGSKVGRKPNANRDHSAGHQRLMNDYFVDNPVYSSRLFRRRYRMPRDVFDRLHTGVLAADDYFRQRPDAAGKCGLSSYQKITAALRMFCYGIAADATDEYIRIGETTARESFRRLTRAILDHFGDEYLRQPTAADFERHLKINKERGFPGMFGSLDCTHWVWKNCSVGWQGMFQDRNGDCSLIMEAVATRDLWIWHSFVGMPGSNNDINVVDRSPLIVNWLKGEAPSHRFKVNGRQYTMNYLLCDGIYPRWSAFVKTVSEPETEKEKLFAKKQEAARKDVERCFGVLQGRFAILSQPGRGWDRAMMRDVWLACVVMHNMVVEAESTESGDSYLEPSVVTSTASSSMTLDRLLNDLASLQDTQAHTQLQADLIERIWKQKERHAAFYELD